MIILEINKRINNMVDRNSKKYFNKYYELIVDYEQENIKKGYKVIDKINNKDISSREITEIFTSSKCKFCGSTDAVFSKTEHMYPESVGNKVFISKHSECDNCNAKFGETIENDFYNFLGETLAINQVPAKGKRSRFKSYDKDLKVLTDADEKLTIKTTSNNIKFLGNNTIDFAFRKNYKLLNVYKTLLKMAISTISETDNINLNFSKMLLNYENPTRYEFFLKIFSPIPLSNEIRVILYKRKDNKFETFVPTYHFAFIDRNILLEIPVFSDSDIDTISKGIEKCLLSPIPFNFEINEKENIYLDIKTYKFEDLIEDNKIHNINWILKCDKITSIELSDKDKNEEF